jgi:molybdenum cofactor cytidylyltransferase
MVAAILLAAGASTRYGANKLALPFGAGTVISTVAAAVAQTAARGIVAVTGHDPSAVAAALAGQPVVFAHNPGYAAGEMLSSIQAGLRFLESSGEAPEAAMIVLGDQPLVSPALMNRLIDAFERGCGEIVAPRLGHAGRRGHPVIFGRTMWPELLALPPGASAREVLLRRPERVAHVIAADDGMLRDVDTPAEYQSALAARRPAR